MVTHILFDWLQKAKGDDGYIKFSEGDDYSIDIKNPGLERS